MSNFSQQQIDEVWAKATIDPFQDKNIYRKDIAGAWIEYSKYGKEGSMGWEIDHILPQARGGSDQFANLQPLQYQNNRSKGDDYPNFHTVISAEGNQNISKLQHFSV